MAKLIGLGLENFRVFKDYTEFDFAPLTLLTGANNSGKSSLVKALLLLSVNVKNNISELKLDFEESTKLTKLGNYNSVKNKNSRKHTISFTLFFENLHENLDRPLHNKELADKIFYEIAKKIFKLTLSYYDKEKENMADITFLTMEDEKEIKLFSFKLNKNKREVASSDVNYVWLEKFIFEFEGKKDFNTKVIKELSENMDFKRYTDLYNIIDLAFNTRGKDILREKYHFDFLDDVLKQLLKVALNSIQFEHKIEYLPAFRASQERSYDLDIDMPFNKLLKQFISNKFQDDSKEMKFINHWINRLGIGNKIEIKTIGRSAEIYIINGSDRLMADYGFGVTQYLPLLLKIVLNPNKILIIEEGENSLHPNFQSRLADMLIDASKPVSDGGFGIRFIVETHSEYLIRKMQYLIAKQEKGLEIRPEDVLIYYFKNPETVKVNENLVNKITIDENGLIDDGFGTGFIDEADNLAIYLHNLKFQKR